MTKAEILALMKEKGKADALDLRSRAKDLDGTAIIAEESKIPLFDPNKDYSNWAVGSPVYEIVDGGSSDSYSHTTLRTTPAVHHQTPAHSGRSNTPRTPRRRSPGSRRSEHPECT